MADLCRAADRPCALWLAWPQRRAHALCRRPAAAAGLCGIALRHGSAAGAHHMKYLLVLIVIIIAVGVWRSQRRAEARERRQAAAPRNPAKIGRASCRERV